MAEVSSVGSKSYEEWLERGINKTASSTGKSNLGIDDFLKLMAAQLRNQDMNNPMSDTEYMGQLAQFSSLEAMESLQTLNATTYSIGLLGKEITVAKFLKNGDLMTSTGTVTGIGLFDGDPIVYIGEESYSLSEIMAVGKVPEKQTEEGGDSGNGTSGGE